MAELAMRMCALTLAVIGLVQQTPTQLPSPPIRTEVRLVQVDVVVVDVEGRPVRGLGKSDFRVFDNGREQIVASLEEVAHTRQPASLLPTTLKSDVADNSTARGDRLIVLIIDDLHFQGKTEHVKHIARSIVNDLGRDVSLALVTTSGQFGVEPTEDRALLLAEIDRFVDKVDPEGRRLASGARRPPMRPPVRGSRGPQDLATFFGDMTQYRTLEDVARLIGGDATRRKAFVWISGGGGGPVEEPQGRVSSSREDHYLAALAGLLERLRESGVSTYSVDTGDFSSALLTKVSEASGGFVVRAENIDRELERLVSDLDHYYLLGFYPVDTKSDRYRPVEIKLNRPGITVRHRRGYLPGRVAPTPKNKDALAQLAEGVLPKVDLPLRLNATALRPTSSRDVRLVVALEVRADPLRLLDPDGAMRDVLKYSVWAVDLQKKKATSSVAREAKVVTRPDIAAQRTGPFAYQVRASLLLPPGRYPLRASASSAKLQKAGSVYLETEVPDFRGRVAQLGGIMLGYDSAPRIHVVPTALVNGGPLFEPTLDREFIAGDTLRVFCEGRIGALPSDMTVDLLGSRDEVVKPLERRTLSPAEPMRVDLRLPLGDLQPGGYRLRVTASDGAHFAKREVGFVVR